MVHSNAELGAAGIELISYERPEHGGLLRLADKEVELTALEFELVERLLRRARQRVANPIDAFVSFEEFASLSWNTTAFTVNQLRVLVHRLRERLTAAGFPDLVENKRGIGYRLRPAHVAPAPAPPPAPPPAPLPDAS